MPMLTRPSRYRLILLPVDDSEAARYAAAHTAALAAALGATVAILAVMDTGGALAFTPEAAAQYTRLRTEAQEAIETASAIVRGAGADIPLVEHLIMDGVPATMIVETAAELGADLIVLGVSARDTRDTAPGALAAAVLRDAPCPVLIVPLPHGGNGGWA